MSSAEKGLLFSILGLTIASAAIIVIGALPVGGLSRHNTPAVNVLAALRAYSRWSVSRLLPIAVALSACAFSQLTRLQGVELSIGGGLAGE